MTDSATQQNIDKILPAISAAMGQIKIIAKENDNKFDKYKFASIDDFLEMVNPICVANGLLFHMQEGVISEFMKNGRSGESSWLRVTFEITAYHISGQSLPAVFRSVEVQRTGAQAYGSAQSYALKQYMRSLLLIPTGDKDDADFRAQEAGVASKSASPSYDAASMLNKIKRATTADTLNKVAAEIKALDIPSNAKTVLRNEWANQKAQIDAAEQAELTEAA